MAVKTRHRVIVRRRLRRPVWDGIARIFDFTGSLNAHTRPLPLPPDVADQRAIWMDWKVVADDLETVMGSQASGRAPDHRRGAYLKGG